MVALVTVRSIRVDIQFCHQHFRQCDIRLEFDLYLNFDASMRVGDIQLVLSLYQARSKLLWNILPYNNREVRIKNYSLPEELDDTETFVFGFCFRGPNDNSIEVIGEEIFSETFVGKWITSGNVA